MVNWEQPITPWVSYRWLYLCNSDRRLAITLRALPKHRPLQGCLGMHICWASHLDHPSRPEQFLMTASSLAPSWLNFWITDLSQFKAHLPKELELYWANDKKRWALGMKLLMPYVVGHDEPFLYTDDDVLLTGDPQPWMTNSFGSKGCYRFPANKRRIAAELFNAFELPYGDLEWDGVTAQPDDPAYRQYNRAALDAGVWFQRERLDWSERLYRFAKLPYIWELTLRNLELRCLDQRFLTCFGMKHNWDLRTIGNGFAPPAAVSERSVTRHPFFHYKSQSKETWMTRLEAWLQETGR